MLKHIENFFLTRIKSASFSTTGGTRGFLKDELDFLSKILSLETKYLQYCVLGKEVIDASYLFILLIICQT